MADELTVDDIDLDLSVEDTFDPAEVELFGEEDHWPERCEDPFDLFGDDEDEG